MSQPSAPEDVYSIIVCSVDQHRFDALSASLARAFGACPYEVIRIAGARSMCEGYNQGLRRSRGSRLIFCHDDIELLSDDFVARLQRHYTRFDVFGVAGTTRLIDGAWAIAGKPFIHGSIVQPRPNAAAGCELHLFSYERKAVSGAQALDGVLIAAGRSAVDRLGWDETHIPGFHLYDIDFSFRAHLAGLRVGIATDLLIHHASLGSHDQAWKQAALDFYRRHGHHLPDCEPGDQAHPVASCPDKRTAYLCFRDLLDAQEAGTGAAAGI